jgi:hypothetical protein
MPFPSTSPSPRSIKTSSRKNPEEGVRYWRQYICKFCKYLIRWRCQASISSYA